MIPKKIVRNGRIDWNTLATLNLHIIVKSTNKCYKFDESESEL